MNKANCKTCEFKRIDDGNGGHCYMFRVEPEETCHQWTPAKLTHEQVLQAAVDRWGITAQTLMTCEEAGEVIQALMHFHRGRGSKEAVAEEVADLTIMLRQMRQIFGPELVDQFIEQKMARLQQRVLDADRQVAGYCSGHAWLNSRHSRIKVPSEYIDQIDLAHVLAHEFGHNRGLVHRQMNRDPYYSRVGRWREIYAWAADLTLVKTLPKAKARPSPDLKLAHAQAMFRKSQTKAKRANTLLKKWHRKVRYYEKQHKLAAEKAMYGH